MRKMRKRIFIAISMSYMVPLVILMFQPASAASGSYFANLIIHFSFLAIALIMAFLVSEICDRSPKRPTSFRASLPYSNTIVWICIGFSILGLFLVYYDRVFVRGIDYSLGLRAARYQWRGTTGGNFAGVIGNILNSFGYISILYAIVAWKKANKLIRLFLVVSICCTIFGMGFLNAGRSNVLVAIVFAMSLFLIYQPGSLFEGLRRNTRKILIIIAVACVFIFIITISSANLGKIEFYKLYELGISDLYGQLDKDASFEDLPDIIIFFYYIVAYLFHGQWTSQIALSLPAREPFYVFGPIQSFLSYFGILSPNQNEGFFADTGAFISFPGALYYDFGAAGIVLGGLFMGTLLGIAIWIARNNGRKGGFLKIIFAVSVISHFLLSSFCIYYGFLSARVLPAPFILIWLVTLVKLQRRENFRMQQSSL